MKIISFLTLLFLSLNVFAQQDTSISVTDISNFWNAYDQVIVTKDTTAQKDIIRHSYSAHASAGLNNMVVKGEQYQPKTAYVFLDEKRSC